MHQNNRTRGRVCRAFSSVAGRECSIAREGNLVSPPPARERCCVLCGCEGVCEICMDDGWEDRVRPR